MGWRVLDWVLDGRVSNMLKMGLVMLAWAPGIGKFQCGRVCKEVVCRKGMQRFSEFVEFGCEKLLLLH